MGVAAGAREKAERLEPLLDVWERLASTSTVLDSVIRDFSRANEVDAELATARADVDQQRQAMVVRLMDGPVPSMEVGVSAAVFTQFQTDGSAVRMYAGAAAALRNRAWSTAQERAEQVFRAAAEVVAGCVAEASGPKLRLPKGVVSVETAATANAASRWQALTVLVRRISAAHRVATQLRLMEWIPGASESEELRGRRPTPTLFLSFRYPSKLPADWRAMPGPLQLVSQIAAGAEPGLFTGPQADQMWWEHSGWTRRQELLKKQAREAGVRL